MNVANPEFRRHKGFGSTHNYDLHYLYGLNTWGNDGGGSANTGTIKDLAVYGPDVWRSEAAGQPDWVLFDSVRGTEAGTIDDLKDPGDWTWHRAGVYIYSDGDPDTVYTSIESGTNGPVEYYVYQGDQVHLEITDEDGISQTGSDPQLSQRYLYGPGVDQVLAVDDGSDVLWTLGDHQGTIRDVVDSDGLLVQHRTYDAFGQIIVETGSVDVPFAYTGRPYEVILGSAEPTPEVIEILYDYRARWYDPSVGRFLSEDPISFAAGDTNLYRYVGNNPMVYTDPSGLQSTGFVNSNIIGAADYWASTGLPAWRVRELSVPEIPITAASDFYGQKIDYLSRAIAGQQPDMIDKLASIADNLGYARSSATWTVHNARQEARDAWFFPGSANERALEALKTGHALDNQIEEFRQVLAGRPEVAQAIFQASTIGTRGDEQEWVSAAMGSLSSQRDFNATLRSIASRNMWFRSDGAGIQPSWNPVEMVGMLATIPITMTASVAGATINSVSRTSGSVGLRSVTYGAQAEIRPILSQYVAGVGIKTSTGTAITEATLAPTVSSTVGYVTATGLRIAPKGLVRNLMFKDALQIHKGTGQLTNAGRALTKHPEMLGHTKDTLRAAIGKDPAVNQAAHSLLKDIMRNGASTTARHSRYGTITTFRLPNGLGTRFETPTNRFIGFIN